MRIKLGISMKLKEIALASGGILNSDRNDVIEYITTDSREVQNGDLYVAVKGERYDGNTFIYDAAERGGIIMSSESDLSDIYVSDTVKGLLSLSSFYIKRLENLKYKIGITGSVGKTTTKEFLKTILSEMYHVHANKGNLNNCIGMPLSVLSCPPKTEIIIMEMGMNHPGEISQLSKCLCPDIAVITNIGTSHIGYLKSRSAIAKAKLEITDGMSGGAVIVPLEEPLLRKASRLRTYSTKNASADFHLHRSKDGTVSIYHNGFLLCSSSFQFGEEHLVKCLAAAVGAGLCAGINPVCLSDGLSNISDENVRQKVISIKNVNFYTDYYNASFESVIACIEHLKRLCGYPRKSLILGDILELGEHSEAIHRKIGRLINCRDFYSIFLFGNNAKYIGNEAVLNGFPTERIFCNCLTENPEITASQVIKNTIPGEILLVKASRGMRMEKVMEQIKLASEENFSE